MSLVARPGATTRPRRYGSNLGALSVRGQPVAAMPDVRRYARLQRGVSRRGATARRANVVGVSRRGRHDLILYKGRPPGQAEDVGKFPPRRHVIRSASVASGHRAPSIPCGPALAEPPADEGAVNPLRSEGRQVSVWVRGPFRRAACMRAASNPTSPSGAAVAVIGRDAY